MVDFNTEAQIHLAHSLIQSTSLSPFTLDPFQLMSRKSGLSFES